MVFHGRKKSKKPVTEMAIENSSSLKISFISLCAIGGLPHIHEVMGLIPRHHLQVYNPVTLGDLESEWSAIQAHPQLHKKFSVSLGY